MRQSDPDRFVLDEPVVAFFLQLEREFLAAGADDAARRTGRGRNREHVVNRTSCDGQLATSANE